MCNHSDVLLIWLFCLSNYILCSLQPENEPKMAPASEYCVLSVRCVSVWCVGCTCKRMMCEFVQLFCLCTYVRLCDSITDIKGKNLQILKHNNTLIV